MDLTQLGITGVLALLLVRETFAFLKASRSDQLDKQLTSELKKLNEAISNLTQTLVKIGMEVRSVESQVRECRRDIEDLKRERQ